MRSDNVYLKSPDDNSTPYLVTSGGVYKIRVQNHSNYQMVGFHARNDGQEGLVGFVDFNNSLIPEEVKPRLNQDMITGLTSLDQLQEPQTANDSADLWNEFIRSSLCSPSQFDTLSKDHCIFQYGPHIFKPTQQVQFEIMKTAINFWIDHLSQSIDWEFSQFCSCSSKIIEWIIDQTTCKLQLPTSSVTRAVLTHYLTESNGLDHAKVMSLVTEVILCKMGHGKLDDLLLNITIEMNSEYTPDLDPLALIKGKYYTANDDEIFYCQLDSRWDVKERLDYLFQLKPKWDIADLEAFVGECNVNKMKFGKFLLKHRVKVNGTLCYR